MSERPTPGLDLSHRAREACSLVRASLINLADLLGVDRPEYLTYCPPGDFRDDHSWSTAVVMTGVREDPDFPKKGESSEVIVELLSGYSTGSAISHVWSNDGAMRRTTAAVAL